MSKKKIAVWSVIGMIIIALVAMVLFLMPHYRKIKADFVRLESENYDTVFFSMYPTDNYVEGDYMHFRGMQTVRTAYEIPSGRIMRRYMEKVNETDNVITTVYLGIDPEKTVKEDIVLMIQENPAVMFEVALAHPQIDYWTKMSEAKCEKVLEKYRLFAEEMMGLSNARTYFFSGEEWLICNQENYEDIFLTNVAVSQFLMCNSDYQHPYMLKAETLDAWFLKLKDLIKAYRTEPVEYPDCSGCDIVFLGDSIIGNYTDSLSVPMVVKALTGANVYNCGYSGKSAAMGEKDSLPVPMIAEAIISEEISGIPQDAQVYQGVLEFVQREDKTRKLKFVINYGLNDYFNGYPVKTGDSHDVYSYSGALRLAVEKLKEAYPDAEILLLTPNFTIQFDYGESIQSENGGKLEDYANAVLVLSQEMGVGVLDNFNELSITEENWKEYLVDGVHLTEAGRFLVGSRIALKITGETK